MIAKVVGVTSSKGFLSYLYNYSMGTKILHCTLLHLVHYSTMHTHTYTHTHR